MRRFAARLWLNQRRGIVDGDVLQVLTDYPWDRFVALVKHHESDDDGTGARPGIFVGSPSLHVGRGGGLQKFRAADDLYFLYLALVLKFTSMVTLPSSWAALAMDG
jgi:hypothetical protein